MKLITHSWNGSAIATECGIQQIKGVKINDYFAIAPVYRKNPSQDIGLEKAIAILQNNIFWLREGDRT